MAEIIDRSVFENKIWTREIEKSVSDHFEKLNIGKFEIDTDKEIFGIDTPPPYPSGRPWHLGAVAHYSKIDMIARANRMLGKEVLFPIGMDRNGLPVEKYTEKKHGIIMRDTPRKKFLELCRESLDELEKEMIEILKTVGYSADFDNIYRTDSPVYRALTQSTFIEHWKNGRVYKGYRPSNYCVDCGTTIADAEIEYKELKTRLVYIKFRVEDGDEHMIIATTRPELLGACETVIVNAEDKRYESVIGKHIVTPIYGKKVKVITHPSAKPEFGSGAVMVCSYGDYNDAMLFKELGLTENILIDTNGKMNANAGKDLEGLTVEDARKKMIGMLKEGGFVDKSENIAHRTPLCDRSKTPIEIIPMEEYYLKIVDLKEDLDRLINELNFITPQHKQILTNWLKVTTDWPISRRRYYGTEIPIWYCKSCGEPFLPEPGKYYRPWEEKPPGNPTCTSCGKNDFIGDTRTFDTWMDSSVSALFVTKYGADGEFNKKTYPLNVRIQGLDIIRTWLNYSIIRCYQLTDRLPWNDVFIDGVGLDEHGEKMSKSKGNYVDPMPIVEKYSVDAFRFWAASDVSPGSNFLFSELKIVGANKFLTKLWNVAKFINGFGNSTVNKPERLQDADMWILAETKRLVSECRKAYTNYNLFVSSNKVREFVWNVFAPHYIELVKGRAYGEGFTDDEKNSAIYTLNYVLKNILKLLAPITPFISEIIWIGNYSKESIHTETITSEEDENGDYYVELGKKIMDFDGRVWNAKKEKGISLKNEISVEIPVEIKTVEKDLVAMHNIKI